MRDICELLNEMEEKLEQVRREVEALRLTAQLLNEPEDPPEPLPARDSELETGDSEGGETGKVSTRLRRLASPLFGTVVP